jgi:hypothetical protein
MNTYTERKMIYMNRCLAILLALAVVVGFGACRDEGRSTHDSPDAATAERTPAAKPELYQISPDDEARAIEMFKGARAFTDIPPLVYADDEKAIICGGGQLIVFDRESNAVTRAVDVAKLGYTQTGGDSDGAFGVDVSADGNKIYFTPNASDAMRKGVYEPGRNVFYYEDFDTEALALFDNYVSTEVLLDAKVFKRPKNDDCWYSDCSVLLDSDTFLCYLFEESKGMGSLRIIVSEEGMEPEVSYVFG